MLKVILREVILYRPYPAHNMYDPSSACSLLLLRWQRMSVVTSSCLSPRPPPPPTPPTPQVAEDECRHFQLLEARLREVGSHYGALPAHDGLWESASHTSHRCGGLIIVLFRWPEALDLRLARRGRSEIFLVICHHRFPHDLPV